MKLTIQITMDNSAFEPDNGTEAARILRALADRLDGDTLRTHDLQPLCDINGNRVGEAKVTR